MILVLLLASANLAAQLAKGQPNPVEIWPSAHACPVRFSVGRKAEGAVVWTGGESDWINAHSGLSLPELQNALKQEPEFQKLSAQEQAKQLDRVAQLYSRQHGQGLDISFARPEVQIVSADVVVHGYPATAHIIPAAPNTPSEITETFHLTAGADQPLLSTSVWTTRMVVISWAELTRLEYEDGSTWTAAVGKTGCRAFPSLYVPVGLTAH
jgi:hypothetical protein